VRPNSQSILLHVGYFVTNSLIYFSQISTGKWIVSVFTEKQAVIGK